MLIGTRNDWTTKPGADSIQMTEASSTVGFVVIIILYAVIGLLASAGSVAVAQKYFPGRSEQIFYGALLVPIAGFYLAFVAYFGNVSSWRTELIAIIAFSVLGIAGTRYAAVLILGYALHGIWDALHELGGHNGFSPFGSGEFTAIPLAYGVFCAVFDIAVAAYFVRRKQFWK
jgi:hypothetical protein